jgi:hypothetical protein
MLIEDNKRYILRNGHICRPTAAYKSTFHSGGIYNHTGQLGLIFNPAGECLNTLETDYDFHPFDIMAEAIEGIHWRQSMRSGFDIDYLYDVFECCKSFAQQFHVVTHEIIDEHTLYEGPTYQELQASNLKLHQRVAELEEFVKAAIYLSRKFKDLTEKHFHKLPKELQEELS